MVENYGCNDLIYDLRSGQVTLDKAVDKVIQAWLSVVQQTASRPCTEGIMGVISTEEFQGFLSSLRENNIIANRIALHFVESISKIR